MFKKRRGKYKHKSDDYLLACGIEDDECAAIAELTNDIGNVLIDDKIIRTSLKTEAIEKVFKGHDERVVAVVISSLFLRFFQAKATFESSTKSGFEDFIKKFSKAMDVDEGGDNTPPTIH